MSLENAPAPWAKLRIIKGQEFVIGVFTPVVHVLDGIIVGCYRDNDLVYVARTRNGFVPAMAIPC